MTTIDTTEHRGYRMPVPTNFVRDDVETLRMAIEALDGDVDALFRALADKANKNHGHDMAAIDGLAGALAGKAPADHVHSLGGLHNVDDGADTPVPGSILYANAFGAWVVGSPASVLGSHEHAINNVQGLQEALNNKLDTASLPGALAAPGLKATPVDADSLVMVDSADGNKQKRLSIAGLKAAIKSYLDSIYAFAAHVHAAATTSSAGFMSAADKAKLEATNNASNLTTGRIADALLSGSYTGLTQMEMNRIRLLQTTSASLTSTTHSFQIGADDGPNIRMSPNRIVGGDSGLASPIYIPYGISFSSGVTLGLADGGTGGATAAAARTSLGLGSFATLSSLAYTSSLLTGVLDIANGGTGQSTEAGMRGVYTGSSSSNTAFPIGTTLLVAVSSIARNAAMSPGNFSTVSSVYENDGSGAAMAGTWRARGAAQSASGTLAQRTA